MASAMNSNVSSLFDYNSNYNNSNNSQQTTTNDGVNDNNNNNDNNNEDDYSTNSTNNNNDTNNDSGNIVKMRGLPYSVSVNDIKEFFKPLIPANINLLFGDDGRLSGEAEVEFSTPEDTDEALKNDRKYIGTRYIELFLKPTNDSNNYSYNNNNNNNNNDNSSIPSLFNQMAYFSSQQFMNQNYNKYNSRKQFNNKRGGKFVLN